MVSFGSVSIGLSTYTVGSITIDNIVGILGLFAIGAGFLLYGAYGAYQGLRETRAYRQTTGTVIASELKEKTTGGKVAMAGWKFVPNISYRYQVGGEKYENNRFTPGLRDKVFSKDEVEAQLEEYPEGKSVELYYNPEDPGDSFLTTEGTLWMYIGYGVLALFGLLMLGLDIVVAIETLA